jgi:hypothetical protein
MSTKNQKRQTNKKDLLTFKTDGNLCPQLTSVDSNALSYDSNVRDTVYWKTEFSFDSYQTVSSIV